MVREFCPPEGLEGWGLAYGVRGARSLRQKWGGLMARVEIWGGSGLSECVGGRECP